MISLQALIPVFRIALLTLFACAAWAQGQEPVEAGRLLTPAASQPSGQHIFGIVPSHNTLPNLSMAAPLGTREKFRLAGADSFDQAAFVLAGFYAGIGQWQDQYPEFGQGAAGLAKRYATAYADQVIGNYMTEAVFPTLLHQDPRYYRMAHGRFISRVTYAAGRIFITRSDSGARQFNFSQLAGTATAASIANIYYPDRNLSGTMQRFGILLASGVVFDVMKEYWPDIRQKLNFHRHAPSSDK